MLGFKTGYLSTGPEEGRADAIFAGMYNTSTTMIFGGATMASHFINSQALTEYAYLVENTGPVWAAGIALTSKAAEYSLAYLTFDGLKRTTKELKKGIKPNKLEEKVTVVASESHNT